MFGKCKPAQENSLTFLSRETPFGASNMLRLLQPTFLLRPGGFSVFGLHVSRFLHKDDNGNRLIVNKRYFQTTTYF